MRFRLASGVQYGGPVNAAGYHHCDRCGERRTKNIVDGDFICSPCEAEMKTAEH